MSNGIFPKGNIPLLITNFNKRTIVMKVRYISDLHLGINKINKPVIPPTQDDQDQILILAGDICDEAHYGIDYLTDLCNRFKYVLYVFGNHEHYRNSLTGAEQTLLDQFDGNVPSNLKLLNCDFFEYENVVFIGATLWTDFEDNNPLSVFDVTRSLNDFFVIKDEPNGKRLSADRYYSEHIKHKDYITIQAKMWKERGKDIVVITHHAPSELSIHKQFKGNAINGGFCSNLEDLIEELDVDVWIHGHMHQVHQYTLHNTKILCNPKGYNFENDQQYDENMFDPLAYFEI